VPRLFKACELARALIAFEKPAFMRLLKPEEVDVFLLTELKLVATNPSAPERVEFAQAPAAARAVSIRFVT